MRQKLISLGWIFPIVYILGSLILGFTLPEYNTVEQTLSEIGEEGSPRYIIWKVFSICIDICSVLFGLGIMLFAKHYELNRTPAVFIICYGLSGIGSAAFASPHLLHNVFGASNLIWYCTPLLFALMWTVRLGRMFRNISIIMFFFVMVIGTILNLNPMFDPLLYPMAYYGIAQRFIVYGFNIYCVYIALTILKYRDQI